MPFVFNDKIRGIEPYDPVEGSYRIRLDANESFLMPAEEIRMEIARAVSETALNRYPDPLASDVCARFAAYYGVDPTLVTAGNGSDELISILMSAFLQKGDKVLTLSPDFSMYRFYSGIAEAQCITLDKPEDFSFPIDAMIETIQSEQVRMVIFSNPCNPSSRGVCAEEVRRLVRAVDALVVLDEAYMDFWSESLLEEVGKYDNLVVLRTCSKAFGMAALRLGFAVANSALTGVLRAVKSPYNVNSVSQAIGSAVLSHPEAVRDAIGRILTSRDMLYDAICGLQADFSGKIDVIRPDTNFVFVRFERAGELFTALRRHGIIVRRMGDFLRITAGRNHENAEVAGAIRRFYEKG